MDLSHLNSAQQDAVKVSEGPVMILAGAGSGKTRTLITRIQFLLEEKGASPYQILAVTFSNKAAREMRERLSQVTSFDIGTFQVTTFHSFCSRLLRSEATHLGLSKHFTIFDDGESNSVAKTVLGRKGINQKDISPNTLTYYVDSVKNLGWFPGSGLDQEAQLLADDPRLWELFLDFESELHRSNAVDFGGLITGVLQLFHNYPDIKDKYQRRFKYVMVDEYQDTNRAQFELIKQLGKSHGNVCVVGDEDQSIYSWRGADIRNILDFEKVFPEAKLIKLEQNYRSSKKIIDAAAQLISYNQERKGKVLWTENPEGDPIKIVECRDEKVEGDYIASQIKALTRKGVKGSDVAIIYRNNSQSRALEDSLRKERIPYHIVAGIKFYDRKEVKDLLSYMRVVVNPKDSLAFSRIINTPARGIGATSLRKLEDQAVQMNLALYEFVEKVVENPFEYKHVGLSAKVMSSLGGLVGLIQEVQALENGPEPLPSNSYEKLLHESGYLEFLKADRSHEGAARLENLQELSTALKQYESGNEAPGLTGFLETITLDSEAEVDHSETVAMMTAHGSKGLEYSYVFVTGAEENLFPSFKSIERGGTAVEEERRLFYVAMTRAMKGLTITFAQGRMLWGSLKFNGPSQFINEIPKIYVEWSFEGTGPRGEPTERSYDEFQSHPDYDGNVYNVEKSYQQKAAPKPKIMGQYPTGIKVLHALYGEGLVVESEGAGNDEKIMIKFKDGVKKRFMVKFAPLQRI
ncbi:MAG: UvrD-helicase domain-containing protein [Bacteriovoracaceae bacterium]|nr:UvrD-helicase domain-containing protein [Bacteriovoracaceae bacterium]